MAGYTYTMSTGPDLATSRNLSDLALSLSFSLFLYLSLSIGKERSDQLTSEHVKVMLLYVVIYR